MTDGSTDIYNQSIGGTIYPQTATGTSTTYTFTRGINVTHEIGVSNYNAYWHAKDVSATNNNLQEDYAFGLDPFRPAPTVDINITNINIKGINCANP